MIPAILCGIAAAVLLCIILFFLLLLFVFLYEKKSYQKGKGTKSYRDALRRRYVRSKLPRFKNLRLYFLILDYTCRGEEKRAAELSPFLRTDPLFGIK